MGDHGAHVINLITGLFDTSLSTIMIGKLLTKLIIQVIIRVGMGAIASQRRTIRAKARLITRRHRAGIYQRQQQCHQQFHE